MDPNYWQHVLADASGLSAYNPLINWRTMVIPPEDPNSNAYRSQVRYVWHLFMRNRQGVEEFFVAVTRTIPGEQYPWAGPPSGSDPLYRYIPWPFTAPFSRGGPEAPAPTRVLIPVGGLPGGHQSFWTALPPGTQIRSNTTGMFYTVVDIKEGGQTQITLREMLDPADDSALPVGAPKGAVGFTWFPPSIRGDRSPFVAGLFF